MKQKEWSVWPHQMKRLATREMLFTPLSRGERRRERSITIFVMVFHSLSPSFLKSVLPGLAAIVAAQNDK